MLRYKQIAFLEHWLVVGRVCAPGGGAWWAGVVGTAEKKGKKKRGQKGRNE